MFFALFASALSQTLICFYQYQESECPSGFTLFSTSDFDQFQQSQHSDNSYVFHFAADMINEGQNLVIDFSNVDANSFEVTFKSDSFKQVFADISLKPSYVLTSISLENVNVFLSQTDYEFNSLKMRSSILNGFSIISSKDLNTDSFSLSNIQEISPETVFVSLHDFQKSASVKISKEADIEFSEITSSLTTSVIGKTVRFTDPETKNSFSLLCDSISTDIKISHNKENVIVNLESVFNGVDEHPPLLAFYLNNNAILALPESNSPPISTIAVAHVDSASIQISNGIAPISIDGTNVNIHLKAQTVKITGYISLSDKIVFVNDDQNQNLVLNTVSIEKEGASMLVDFETTVIINNFVSNSFKCNFEGAAKYQIVEFRAETYNAHFSNFVCQQPVPAFYILGKSSFLSSNNFIGELTLTPKFIGNEPTQEEVEAHFNEKLELAALVSAKKSIKRIKSIRRSANTKNDASIKILFPRDGLKGFNSATNIYSDLIEENSASIILDHHYLDFNNDICYNTGTEGCPEGSVVFSDKASFLKWEEHVRPTATILNFYFVTPLVESIDFTNWVDVHPDVYINAMAVILEQKFIGGQLGTITIDGKDKLAQIVINRESSPVMIISPLKLYNVKIAPHSIETINCTLLSSIHLDPKTLAQFPVNCVPETLVLEKFDDFSSIEFSEESIKFANSTTAGVTDITYQLKQASRPLFNLTTAAESLTLSVSEGTTQTFAEFQHFEMTSANSVLYSEIPSTFKDVVNGYGFNGVLNVESEFSNVPLKFVDNKKVEVQSPGNVEFSSSWEIDNLVDLNKLGKDASLIFDDVHFGPKAQIEGESSAILANAFFDSREKHQQSIKKVVHKGTVKVSPSTSVSIDEYVIDGESPVLSVGYRMAEIPSINLNKVTQKSGNLKVIFEYEESTDEATYSEKVQDEYSDVNIPVICGKELICDKWAFEFSSKVSQFEKILNASCTKNCVNLNLINLHPPTPAPTPVPTTSPTEPPTEKPTEKPTEQPSEQPTETTAPTPTPQIDDDKIMIIVGAAAATTAVVCIIIGIVFCVRKKRVNAQLNNSKLLASTY
ncbi:hypothetical protein TRFO_27265 [Tritrichomonas foetus]|uniref:Uncharacterized protein n=1 Tax=Tritrichomonas foetus TaxID=1144522 RepID=A0A1J4K6Q3_9EUKA|nr:hypothetical protein TRFO_27265 [Tritrichomonas foetus]|eukprot:OHT05133.1 hypothetical protein TRFO_27265 [Tritrichomonas foetus]